jgi:hypothetical protein
MKYLINYADLGFYNSRTANSISGIQAGFDAVIQYKKEDIDSLFYEKNKHILSQRRGAGYWLWKPYIIYKTLKRVDEGDVVFYSDAGSRFIKKIDSIFEAIENEEFGVIAFEMAGSHKENEYCRKSVVKKILGEVESVYNTDQRMASFVVTRKCDSSLKKIETWLNLCQETDIILDKPLEDQEFKEFKDHRHDQAIWSLLTKKLNILTLPDPTQWGIAHGQTKESDFFIEHHRKKI